MTNATRRPPWALIFGILSIVAFFLGGFYGCQAVARFRTNAWDQMQLEEVVHISQFYMRFY
jgi:hypothetical protein